MPGHGVPARCQEREIAPLFEITMWEGSRPCRRACSRLAMVLGEMEQVEAPQAHFFFSLSPGRVGYMWVTLQLRANCPEMAPKPLGHGAGWGWRALHGPAPVAVVATLGGGSALFLEHA